MEGTDEPSPRPVEPERRGTLGSNASAHSVRPTPLEMPEELNGIVDTDYWGQLGALTDLEDPTSIQINTLIGTVVALWNRRNLFGTYLHAHFTNTFEDWDKSRWTKASYVALKLLRTTLMDRGVFVGLQHQSIKADILAAATRNAFRLWTPEEIESWTTKNPALKQRLDHGGQSELTERNPWEPPKPPGKPQGHQPPPITPKPSRLRTTEFDPPVQTTWEPALPQISDEDAMEKWLRIQRTRTHGPDDLFTRLKEHATHHEPTTRTEHHENRRDYHQGVIKEDKQPAFIPRGDTPPEFIQPTPKQILDCWLQFM